MIRRAGGAAGRDGERDAMVALTPRRENAEAGVAHEDPLPKGRCRAMGMTDAQRKHLAEAENKKRMGNEHYKRHDFTHENEDMRWAVRRYTEALRELDTLTGTPLLDKKGWTPPVVEQDTAASAVEEAGDGDEEDDVLELGADGSFDAVAHDQSKPAPSKPVEPPVVVTVGKDTAAPTEVAVENLDDEQLAARVKELRISCLLNRAAAHLRCKGYGGNDGAEKDCTTVLQQLDAKNAKALFRRGQARQSMRHFEGAVDDLQRAAKLAPKDSKVAKALKESKLALEAQEKSKKLWNPSEQERRAKAAADERDVIERLTSADTTARKEYGVQKWEAMGDMEKRKIVLEIAVREELERTAPKTVLQRDGDLSLGSTAGAKMDAARKTARAANAAASAASEPAPEPAPVEDSWGAFWQDDKVADREAAEKARLDAARKLEAAAEQAMREKYSDAQDKMRREDQAAADAARKKRRDNLEAVAAAQREAALAHSKGIAGKPMTPRDGAEAGADFKQGFFSAPQPSPAVVPEPEPEPEPEPVQTQPKQQQQQQAAAAATLTAALAAASSGGSGGASASSGGSSSGGSSSSSSSSGGQVWDHCAVPPLHKCRAHYGRKWASLPAETKRLAIVAAEQGTPLP